MARSELALALSRSDAPVPPPEGIVRVPLTGYLPVAAILGTYLGMFLGLLVLFLPPFSNASHATNQWLVPLMMILGTVPGALFTWIAARRRSEGRAIAFDAAHIWLEARGEFADPLPWPGLQLRGGRVPHLVAPDGRAIPFQREALGRGPDARYLTALVERLPKIEAPPRVPAIILGLAVIAGFFLASNARGVMPSPDAEGEFWGPQRLESLAMLLGGATLTVGAGCWLIVRYGSKAEERAWRSSPPDRPGSEIAAYFRAHRFRPPLISLEDGQIYRYREAQFWRAGAKSQREARIALAGMGILFFAASVGLALFGGPQPSGPLPFIVLGIFCLVLFVGIALFAPFLSRSGSQFRVAGGRIYVRNEGEPEASFPWPPHRTREPVELFDWTDELREGRRRHYLDRRLLVADSRDSGNG